MSKQLFRTTVFLIIISLSLYLFLSQHQAVSAETYKDLVVSGTYTSLYVAPHNAGIDLYSTGNFAPHYQTDFSIYKGVPGSGELKFRIDANGNVGIGTSAPAYKLSVAGSGNSFNVVPHNAGVDLYSTGNFAPHYQTDFSIYKGVPGSGELKMRLGSNGNLGIGTDDLNEKLTIGGVLSLQEENAPSATIGFGKLYVKSADSKIYFKNDSGAEIDLTAGSSKWSLGEGGIYYNGGNVGIGTTSPNEKLDIAGNASIGSKDIEGQGIFLMSGFKTGDEKLYLLASNDGKSWNLLNALPLHTASAGSIRDPSIMRYNDKYYIVHTSGAFGDSNSFSIISSPDLINWIHVSDVSTGVTGVNRVWAPEWFVDSDGSVHVFAALSKNSGSTFSIYELRALNNALDSFSTAVEVLGENRIDPYVIKNGSTYYLWYNNSTTSYIEYATSTTLAGRYTVQRTGNWAGWGKDLEGESVVQLNSTTWRIYLDRFTAQGIYYSDSSDNFNTWTEKELIKTPFTISHPTVTSVRDINTFRNIVATYLSNPAGNLILYKNLGIGTTSPSYRLDISDSSTTRGINITNSKASSYGLYSVGTQYGVYGSDGTTSGYLGYNDQYGLYTINNAYIGGVLTVGGNLTLNSDFLPGGNNVYSLGSADYRWKDIFLGSGSLKLYNNYTNVSNYELGQLSFSSNILTLSSGAAGSGAVRPIQIKTGNNAGFFMDSGGNVGIGTTSPTSKLEVLGNAKVSDLSIGSLFKLDKQSVTTDSAVYHVNITAPFLQVTFGSAGDRLVLNTEGAEEGQMVLIVNVGTNTGKLDGNQLQMKIDGGSDLDLPQFSSVMFVFTDSKWIQVGKISDNS